MGSIDTSLSAPVYSSAMSTQAPNPASLSTSDSARSDTNFQDVMGAVTGNNAQQESDPTQVGSQGSGYVTTTAVTSSAAATPGNGGFSGPGATAAQLAFLQAGSSGPSYSSTYIETQNQVAAEQEPGYNQTEFNSYWSALSSGQLASDGGSVKTPAFIAYEGSNPEVVNTELEAAGLPAAFTNLPDAATTAPISSGTSPNTTETAAVQTSSTQPSASAGTPATGQFGGPGATVGQLAILQADPGGYSTGPYIKTLNEVAAEQEPGYNQADFNTYWSALTSGGLASEGGSVKTPAFIAYEGSNPELVNQELEAAGLAPAFTNLADTATSNGSGISV